MAEVRNIAPRRRKRDEARAIERTFLDAIERGDAGSEQLVDRLLRAIRGERPERDRVR